MPDIEIAAEPRSILGKKVARLRRAGVTPANIYGHNVTSQAIQIPTLLLSHTLRAAGATRVVRLSLPGERVPRMVLVRHVSRKPTNDLLLHVDFYEVSMTETTQVDVPIVMVGVAPIADVGIGLPIQQMNTLSVECLPGDIPDHLEADISSLVDMHSAVHVSDLPLPLSVVTSIDPAEVVVSVSARVVEEEVEDVPEEEEAAAEAAAAEEAGESTEETQNT